MIEYEPHEVIQMQQGAIKDYAKLAERLMQSATNELESRIKALIARIIYLAFRALSVDFQYHSILF
jgi:hypothetical protein